MTIATYSELQAAIADFLNRDDLASSAKTFIALAEASINRKLRHWRMEARVTAAFDEGFEALPTDWLETIRLSLDGDGPLRLVSSQEMMELKAETPSGNPRYFTHTADEIELWPTPTSETGNGELVYYARIPALADDATTNWLLTNAPDLYLYGSLLHAAPYLRDDARIQVWGGLFADILASMNDESAAAKFSGPLKMRMPANG